jgi:RHS repeat-associated protein
MNALTIAPSGANNRLTRWGGKTYSYDPNGNLLADGTHSYQWNERNQLTGLSAGATSLASFSYDSLGRRSAKTVAGATTGFVYDGDTFVQELLGASSNSAVKAQLLTGGIDETFLRIEGTSRHSVLADGNNNTVRLLDANQAKVVDYTYEPYGRTTADATNGNTQQYTGRENDNPGNAGGLYYYRARYYMPGCARFISEDPIGWASGQTNNYGYVGGNPVSYIDPMGLDRTIWEPGSGRTWTDGPRNGNWGGKNWSGGAPGGAGGCAPPTDSGDESYMRHDKCWARCAGDRACMRACDYALNDELGRLPRDSRKWPRPPRPGTERDTQTMRDRARWFFGAPPPPSLPSVMP